MKLIHTNDGKYYRRWVNLIPTLFLPGSAQYLGGRKLAGILWLFLYLILNILLVIYWILPQTKASFLEMGSSEFFVDALLILVAIDGFRRPIPCLHPKKWALLLCLWFCLFILPMLVIIQFWIYPCTMPSSTMQPTIMGMRKDVNGKANICDNVFVNKMIYRLSEPERGDVIVFSTKDINSPPYAGRDEMIIKRLAGLPGEKVSINPPNILINNIILTNPPVFMKISGKHEGHSGYSLTQYGSALLKTASDTITLGPDEYLVLGDNSSNSLDSRFYGPIKRKAILGKVFYIYAPADRKGKIE
ncbi:MAG: signal peptidase I [Kiritimatiellia bacterium]